MKIYKTMLIVENNNGQPLLCDTIFFEEKFWLVNMWLDLPDGIMKRPERIVCLSSLPHKKSSGKKYDFLFQGDPIPKAVFDARISPQSIKGYDVRDLPEVAYPIYLN